MFSLTRASLPSGILSKSSETTRHVRCMATEVKKTPGKKEGDISSVFVSLSGAAQPQLPERFANIKRNLIRGNESQLIFGWQKLLQQLQVENEIIAQQGPAVVPRIDFDGLSNPSAEFLSDVKKRGVAIINGVIPEEEARSYKTDVESYVKANPWTKGFPQNAPAVYELYWSPSQVRARAHPNMLSAQSFLLQLWHSKDKDALISTSNPLSYADRLRIRQPGDAGFALGPHVDGGGVERWEPDGYGHGGVYDKIWQGKWEEYDPWESSSRIPVISDLYEGPGACSMFRMFQGWLGMSHTAPKEGTLMVNPLLQLSTAYFLLRPFFTPIKEATGLTAGEYTKEFLQAENWKLKNVAEMTSELQGANPGHGQELNQVLHPHLDLQRTMVHVPKIKPGDYVVWHCDTIHAVDKVHQGKSDASVMYIPVCPTTEANAEYLVRQRECFFGGYPGPDFPGGKGESEHFGRPTASYIAAHSENKGLQAMGLAPIELDGVEGAGAREAVSKANKLLGLA